MTRIRNYDVQTSDRQGGACGSPSSTPTEPARSTERPPQPGLSGYCGCVPAYIPPPTCGYDAGFGYDGYEPPPPPQEPVPEEQPPQEVQLEGTRPVEQNIYTMLSKVPILGDIMRGLGGTVMQKDLEWRHSNAEVRIRNAYRQGIIDETEAQSLLDQADAAKPGVIDYIPYLGILGQSNGRLNSLDSQLDALGIPDFYGNHPTDNFSII